MAKKVIFLKDARSSGVSLWRVPDDFSPVNTIHCIGGGGSGGHGGSDGAAGGGGGAYSAKFNVNVAPGSEVPYRVGIGGIAEEGDGGDTWFGATTYDEALCAARGGKNPPGVGSANKTGGQGGQASEGIGDIRFSGGNSANVGGDEPSGSGGGGAAGPAGNGGNVAPGSTANNNGGHAAGSDNTGGTSSSPHGKMHPVWQETATGEWAGPGGGGYQATGTGGIYGGGGGGEGSGGNGRNGGQGIIVIEYEPASHFASCVIVG